MDPHGTDPGPCRPSLLGKGFDGHKAQTVAGGLVAVDDPTECKLAYLVVVSHPAGETVAHLIESSSSDAPRNVWGSPGFGPGFTFGTSSPRWRARCRRIRSPAGIGSGSGLRMSLIFVTVARGWAGPSQPPLCLDAGQRGGGLSEHPARIQCPETLSREVIIYS